MASHYKWYPSSEEVVVPFSAQYSFPSQANKAIKITPRLTPKNGGVFNPGNVIRCEFPAQGYINPLNTTFSFDVALSGYSDIDQPAVVRFQNNIQSIFSRVRLLYGSTPLEDMVNYNVIVRKLTEWTGTSQVSSMDQFGIADGIGGVIIGANGSGGLGNEGVVAPIPETAASSSLVNVRQAYIQGIDTAPGGFGPVPNTAGQSLNGHNTTIRRYQCNLALGLFTQDKLIPTKFMASQLAIEWSLASEASCIFTIPGTAVGTGPTYQITNFTLIPEMLEFDASYDAMFLKGLRDGGVPIKFSSWHTFTFGIGGQQNLNLLIQERSRSVKALFAVQRRAPEVLWADSGASFFNTGATLQTPGTLQTYQWRIGGRYFPAAPVQMSTSIGNAISNGGAEAFLELEKALNIVGDYRLKTNLNVLNWAVPYSDGTLTTNLNTALSETDYNFFTTTWTSVGIPADVRVLLPGAGNVGSSHFAMAIDLETSNGIEISGLNAEEQADIALIANYSTPQANGYNMEVYAFYDAMIILRENNVLELIQ